jgi:hypothetical protein
MKHFLILFFILFPLLSGCNKNSTVETQLVEGMINLDGIPLTNANITFHPTTGEGEIASGYSNEQGKFTISSQNGSSGQGAIKGEYAVTVSKIDAKFISANSKSNPESGETITVQLVPSIYQDKMKTPLKTNVKQGKNSITLELNSKP